MQKPNNHFMTVTELTMISLPTEMLEEVGIDEFSGIEAFVDRGRIIIQPLEDDEDEDDEYDEEDDECVCCPYCGCCEDRRL